MYKTKILSLLTLPLTLMAFTDSVTMSSYVYSGLSITVADERITQGCLTGSAVSNANATMVTYEVYYEVLKMSNTLTSPTSLWKDTYSVNYRMEAQLYAHVKYKNGFGNLFTEYGNTELYLTYFSVILPSSNNLYVINRTYNAGYDVENRVVSSFNPSYTTVSFGVDNYYCCANYLNEHTYYSASDAPTSGHTFFDTTYNVKCFPFAGNTSSGYELTDQTTYPNQSFTGQKLFAYGTYSFGFDSAPSSFELYFNATSYLARGGNWGQVERITTLSNTVYL